jgi:hypothetical protein
MINCFLPTASVGTVLPVVSRRGMYLPVSRFGCANAEVDQPHAFDGHGLIIIFMRREHHCQRSLQTI